MPVWDLPDAPDTVCAATLPGQILGALEREEQRLFHDRLRQLDRRVLPGTSKLSWLHPKPALDFYHAEACRCGRRRRCWRLLLQGVPSRA